MEMTLEVQAKYFHSLASGEKTIEGRVRKPKLQEIQAGDTLVFRNKEDASQLFTTQVKAVTRYPSFEEMLTKEGFHNCLPGVHVLKEAVDLYHSFPGYREEAEQYGVIAIAIQLATVQK